MHEGKTNISVRRTARHWLLDGFTLLVEALIWMGCTYAATVWLSFKQELVPPFVGFLHFGVGFALLLVVSRFIPNNAYSRTARRDEVVACAMKTALAVCVLSYVVFPGRTYLQFLACVLFFVVLAIERFVLNSGYIRFSMRHNEHGVIICNDETAWQQEALLLNTYGLKLNRLERQTAQLLAEFLAAHPETESVYCAPSALPSAELKAVAHVCREKGLTLHLLPLAPNTLPQTMRSECRGTVGVLSPAKLPLQSIPNRLVKRVTDIVLSLLVLLTVFPVFALIAFICIKRQSRGPVLVSRLVCGMNGKVFKCLTFRTRHYEAAPSFLEGVNDPGYFPFGKFLTNSRLELLPQFLCVLWGSMTIVGSQTMRPERYSDYRQELKQLYASGYRLKAGITSYQFPARASHYSSLFNLQSSLTQADVWYCRNWGFWLDIRIMLQRLGTFLKQSKAKSINYI